MVAISAHRPAPTACAARDSTSRARRYCAVSAPTRTLYHFTRRTRRRTTYSWYSSCTSPARARGVDVFYALTWRARGRRRSQSMRGGELFDLLNESPYSEADARIAVHGMTSAVAYMHA